ncbi:MAG: DUF2752 domain-containing protein [Prevotella sp.]|jgi:hypothetical protein|nr:DUF2752 domain-containing protein [Prevotella sp.]
MTRPSATSPRFLLTLLGAVAVLTVVYIYYKVNPQEVHIFPRCVFLSLTGYRCAGCGLQRAIHSLLHLDIRAALAYNFYFTLLLPWAAAILATSLFRRRHPLPYELLTHRYVLTAVGVVAVVWWVVRNIYGW